MLTIATWLADGYHPLAEDGGLYVAGIEYRIDPTLFPHYTAFVTAHLRYSVFAPCISALVHLTHLPLAWVLMFACIFSLWLTLYAGLQILRRCTQNFIAQLAGVALLGAWSTLPVAGTSLLLVDPYLTARSFTTPLSLLAIAFALDDWELLAHSRKTLCPLLSCAACLALAALLHPLMAACAFAVVILLRLVRRRHWLPWCSAFAVVAVAIAGFLHALAPADPPSVVAASLSRYYWFLSQWQWYELCGLLGPFCMLSLVLCFRGLTRSARTLCRAALTAGGISILLALLFAHEHSASYLIARLQPLRVFLLIYAIMTVLLGAIVTERLSAAIPQRRSLIALLPATVVIVSGIALFSAQRASFPQSRHIELPWIAPANPWSQAFVWIRDNTPRDALFALDADYITTPGEDAQTFRATAQRSVLPDFSKDGGEASITPSLAGLWQQAIAAEFAVQSGTHLNAKANLSRQNDAQRDARLSPLGVTWVLLHANASTSHVCLYNNGIVKVCRLAP